MRHFFTTFFLVPTLFSYGLAVTLPARDDTSHSHTSLDEWRIDKRQNDQSAPATPEFYPNQLWNVSGPHYKDVKQNETLNCWWKAAEAVVAHVSPNWIQNLFIDPSTNRPYLEQGVAQPQADTPLVQLWNPSTSQPKWYPANIANRSQTEDKGMGGFFWPDALSQALSQLGMEADINGVDKITGHIGVMSGVEGCTYHWNGLEGNETRRIVTGCDAIRYETPLSILTGYIATSKSLWDFDNSNGMDDQLWSYFQQCNVTPIMFNTLDVPANDTLHKVMGDYHSYAVTGTWWDGSGQKMVATRNVWGLRQDFTIQDIKRLGYKLLYLANLDRLPKEGVW